MANTATDFGIGNTTRYYTVAGFSIPNTDWNLSCRGRLQATFSTGAMGIACLGSVSGSECLFLYLTQEGVDNYSIIARFRSNGVFVDYTIGSFSTLGVYPVDYLFSVQRVSNQIQVFAIRSDQTVADPLATGDITGAQGVSSGTLYIGCRSDIDTGSMYENAFSDFAFVSGSSLTPQQMTMLATGQRVGAFFAPSMEFRLREANATETDVAVGGTHSAVRHGSGWATTTEFFKDYQFIVGVPTKITISEPGVFDIAGPKSFTAGNGLNRTVIFLDGYYSYENYASPGGWEDVLALSTSHFTNDFHHASSVVADTSAYQLSAWHLSDPAIPAGANDFNPSSSTPSITEQNAVGLAFTVAGVAASPRDITVLSTPVPDGVNLGYTVTSTGAQVGDVMIACALNMWGNNYSGRPDGKFPPGWKQFYGGPVISPFNYTGCLAYKVCEVAGEGLVFTSQQDNIEGGVRQQIVVVYSFAQYSAPVFTPPPDAPLFALSAF